MAAGILPTPAATILLFLLLNLTLTLAFGETHTFSRRLSPSKLGLKKEKLTHFRVFWHDVVSGPNATAVIVASAPAVPSNRSSPSSSMGFGLVAMIDDALTVGPKRSSKLVGRAQGLYAQASQEELGLLMAMNFVFVEGKYNGSTISILGRNKVFSQVREMPIIGGSGLFRFARGYVHASTHSLDLKTGDAVVEYNVYVMHY